MPWEKLSTAWTKVPTAWEVFPTAALIKVLHNKIYYTTFAAVLNITI